MTEDKRVNGFCHLCNSREQRERDAEAYKQILENLSKLKELKK